MSQKHYLKRLFILVSEFGSGCFGLLLPLGAGRKKVKLSLENENTVLAHKLINLANVMLNRILKEPST